MIELFAWLTSRIGLYVGIDKIFCFLECEVTTRYWVLSQVYFVLFILSELFCDQQLGHKQQFLSSVIHWRSFLASTTTDDLLIADTLLNLLRHNSFLSLNLQFCHIILWIYHITYRFARKQTIPPKNGIVFMLDKSRIKTHAHVGPLLPLNPQAVLSPSALLLHSDVIFFLSLKMFAFFNDLSLFECICFCCVKCHVALHRIPSLSLRALQSGTHQTQKPPPMSSVIG